MIEHAPLQAASARREMTRAAAASATAALQAARDAFVDHCDATYVDGAVAALDDCDRLEMLADQLVMAVERLRPALECLDVARDIALYRGPVLSRMRSRFDPDRLAVLAAEAMGEALLSGPAGAVLMAAIRRQQA